MVLEWDPIQLATADLRTLSLYRNGSKAGNIPKPLETQSTKISGLAVDTEYTFHLVLRTSAGTYSSQKLAVKTHKMTDLSGITVTLGVLPTPLRESLEKAVDRIGAKIADTVRIDTTHFVCTEGKGQQWERAVEMNIPVVRPEWLEGCEREGRLVGVRGYYLNADPRLRQIGQGPASQAQSPQRQESHDRQVPIRNSSLHQGSQRPGLEKTNESSSSSTQAEEADGANEGSRPPTPPLKDDRSDAGAPEPKSIKSEPKARREDREYLEEPARPMNGNRTLETYGTKAEQGSHEEETRSGDGESFSEVAL